MTRLHPDDIQAIAERVVFLLTPQPAEKGAVIPIFRQLEIRRQAEEAMAAKMRSKGIRSRV
jgi:hypothetical protein